MENFEEKPAMSRTTRNEELYKKINSEELDSYNVKSNATVIGDQSNDIDVEKIKKILDKRYNEVPKRKSIRIETTDIENPITYDDTKEYDINTVLEKAKDEKKETYEDTRGQKLHNTQYNILNNLNIEKEEEKQETPTDEDLMELINTITINETKQKEDNETDNDLLDDLKGDDNTQTYEGMKEEIEQTLKTEIKEVENQVEEKKESKLDNSFYTENLFNKKDFVESEDDFLEDDKLSLGIKILIALVIISFLVGLFLFLKSFIGF